MATMYRRNGLWYAKWTEGGRERRRSLRMHSRQRVKAELVEIEQALEADRSVDHRRDVPVDEFTTAFLSHVRAEKRPYCVNSLSHG